MTQSLDGGNTGGVGALPAGFVTFMFTDMKASTRLHRHLDDQFKALLAEHHALLGNAVRSHAGSVVKWLGDGMFAAFSQPTQAIAAALDVQRVVGSHPWPQGSEVRVRIGLHASEAQPRGRLLRPSRRTSKPSDDRIQPRHNRLNFSLTDGG